MKKISTFLLLVFLIVCVGCKGELLQIDKFNSQESILPAVPNGQVVDNSSPKIAKIEKEEYIASFEGKFPIDEGTYNAGLAASIINGHVVKPGEIFSFNEVVGRRTEEKGFHKAWMPYYDENHDLQWEHDFGVGICRCSDVLETVRKLSVLKSIEIHPHDITPAYFSYNPGLADATIYWGSCDNKFQNNRDYDIKIKSWLYSRQGDTKYQYLYIEFDKLTYE